MRYASADLASLRGPWPEPAVPGIVHRRAWYEAYATLRSDVFFTTAHDGATLVAVCAFERDGATVRLPVHPHVPHADAIVAPGYADRVDLAALLEAVPFRWHTARFDNVLADSALQRLLPPRALETGRRYADVLPVAREAPLSKNFRAALRKARNKLAKLDGVTFRSVREADELEPAFEQFLVLEASGWKGEAGSAIAQHAELRAFYAALVHGFGARGDCEINLLTAGDKTIAAQFGLRAGDRLYLLKIGYDESYKRVAPGNMLLERVLERYADDPQVRHVDLVSDAPWHASWQPVRREVRDYALFRASVRGLAGWTVARARRLVRRLAGRPT